MIFVTGDTHGDINYAKLLRLKKLNLTPRDYLFICGDAGICWSDNKLDQFLKLYNDIGCTIFFIDGNHENFDMLNKFKVIKNKGAYMHKIDTRIFHVVRGEVLTIGNKTFFCLGGAHSIDKDLRVPYVSWWPNEEITNMDLDNSFRNLEKYQYRVDYVITHCTDTKTAKEALHFDGDNSTEKLNFIDNLIRYKHWYFGHYHVDLDINDSKTCLYQEIRRID